MPLSHESCGIITLNDLENYLRITNIKETENVQDRISAAEQSQLDQRHSRGRARKRNRVPQDATRRRGDRARPHARARRRGDRGPRPVGEGPPGPHRRALPHVLARRRAADVRAAPQGADPPLVAARARSEGRKAPEQLVLRGEHERPPHVAARHPVLLRARPGGDEGGGNPAHEADPRRAGDEGARPDAHRTHRRTRPRILHELRGRDDAPPHAWSGSEDARLVRK